MSDIDTGVVDGLKALDPDGRLEKRKSICDLAMSRKCQNRPLANDHSITWSARSKNVVGNVTPIALARVAARDKCSIRQVNMTISLAFLAPNLVQAAVEGRLPRGISVARLRDAPAEWSRQYAMFGLSV